MDEAATGGDGSIPTAWLQLTQGLAGPRRDNATLKVRAVSWSPPMTPSGPMASMAASKNCTLNASAPSDLDRRARRNA